MQVQTTGTEPISRLSDRAQLSRADFTKVLLTQLQTQNPLEPMDNEKMVNQLVQLQQMDNSTKLSTTLDQFASRFAAMQFENQFTSAAALIGKSVKGEAVIGGEVEGNVMRVSVEGEKVVAWVDAGGADLVPMAFDAIREVRQGAQ